MSEQSSSQNSQNFISSRDAARAYGVTNDYIARLCRQEKLKGKLEGRTWLVDPVSLLGFFDGQGRVPKIELAASREYLSSREAATLYRVTNDYIARLGRQGKLEGELRDGVWMVEKNSLQNFFSHREPSAVEAPMARIAPPALQYQYIPAEPQPRFVAPQHKNLFQNKKLSLAAAALALVFIFIFASPVGAFLHMPPAGELAASVASADSPFFFPFSSIFSRLASFFAPHTTPDTTPQLAQTPPLASSTPSVVTNNTTNNTTNNNYNTYNNHNSYTYTTSGITQTEFDSKVGGLKQELYSAINGMQSTFTPSYAAGGTTNSIALSQHIDRLDGVTISNSIVHSLSGLTDADIPDTITVSNYLPLSGGIVTGDLTVTGTCTGCGGSGGETNWSYFNNSGIRLATTTNQVVIGASATSSLAKFEVVGGALFDQATSTSFFSTISSSTNSYSTTATISTATIGLATTSQFYGSGLNTCTGGFALTWNNGVFGCAVDQTGAGQANPFFWATNYGVVATATTSPFWAQNGVFASSTSHFVNADFANATTTNLGIGTLTGLLYGSNGSVGTIATNTLGLLASSSLSSTYPIVYNAATGAFSLAFGTTTANTWSQLQTFSSGLAAYASSTIGNGTATGGLTISGGATTTGNAYFAGNVGIGTTTPAQRLSVQGSGIFSGDLSTANINATGTITVQKPYYFNGIRINLDGTTSGGAPALSIDQSSGSFGNTGISVTRGRGDYGAFTSYGTAGASLSATTPEWYNGIFGNIGIGSGYKYGIFEANTGTAFHDDSGGGGSLRFVIDPGGNTGIGTSSPYAALSVVGSSGVVADHYTATGTVASTFPFASTTIITSSLASTTNLNISSIASGSLLKTTIAGSVIAAVSGTDYITPSGLASAFPFTPSTFGTSASNATSTLIGFTNGIYALASSTIGDGTTIGGLTINGGATTTGTAKINTTSGTPLTINQGNQTNVAGISLVNVGAGTTGIALSYGGGTSFISLLGTSGGRFTSQYTNGGGHGQSVLGNVLGISTDGAFRYETDANAASVFASVERLKAGGPQKLIMGQDVSNTEVFTVGYSGSIYSAASLGIGTTSPMALLTVLATSTAGSASSTMLFALASSTSGTATSTLFSITNTGSTTLYQIPSSLLKTNSGGTIVAAVAGVDYATLTNIASAFPFTPTTFGSTNANSTSTLIGFTAGFYSLASSTIGNGNQNGGLTISGGATTTGNAYFGGNVGIGTTSPFTNLAVQNLYGNTNTNLFSVASSTASDGSSANTVFSVSKTGLITTATLGGQILTVGAAGTSNTVGIGSNTSASSGLLQSNGANIASWRATFPITTGDVGSFALALGVPLEFATGNAPGAGSAQDLLLYRDTVGVLALRDNGISQGLRIYSTTTNSGNFERAGFNWATTTFTIGTENQGTGVARALAFETGSTTRLTIDTIGNVGIGTTTPGSALSIQGNQFIAGNIISTSSTASIFPYASTTALTATTASTTNLIVSSAGGAAGCATFSIDGTISNTGTACGSGSGSSFPFTPVSYGNATSTTIGFNAGLLSVGSTTINGNATTTGTFYASIASSTNLYGAGLASCQGGNVLTWANGIFGCAADQTSTGAASPFTFSTNYGVITAATTSPIWAQNGIFASSTSQFAGINTISATTTSLSVATTASTTNLNISSIASGNLLKTTTAGSVIAAVAGTDYASVAQSFNFTPTINFGVNTSATSTPLNATLGIFASSTSRFSEISTISASSTLLTVTSSTTVGGVLNAVAGINAGTISAAGIITSTATGANVFPYASSTAITVSGTGYFGTASSTNLTISSIATGNLLKTTTAGSVIAAVAGVDYAAGNVAFPFTPSTFGTTAANSTSTLIKFTAGIASLASSTIGDGSAAGGLTINGNASTTGNLYLGGGGVKVDTYFVVTAPNGYADSTFSVGLGNAAGSGTLDLNSSGQIRFSNAATSNSTTDTRLTREAAGILALNNGTVNSQNFRIYATSTNAGNYERAGFNWATTTFTIGTENQGTGAARALGFMTGSTTRLTIDTTGNVGIGTTSPFAKLTIENAPSSTITSLFSISSSTNTAGTLSTSTIFSVSNTGSTTLYQIPSSLLKTNAGGTIIAAVAGTDYVTGAGLASAFPFTATTYGNSTSTTIGFLAGLLSVGSTTINGSATTTGSFAVGASTTIAGQLNAVTSIIGGTTTLTNLTVTNESTSTFSGNLFLGQSNVNSKFWSSFNNTNGLRVGVPDGAGTILGGSYLKVGTFDTAGNVRRAGGSTNITGGEFIVNNNAVGNTYGLNVTIDSANFANTFGAKITAVSNTADARNSYGVNVDSFSSNGTAFGVYASSTNSTGYAYAFYTPHGLSYFADNVGIGSTSPSSTLSVLGNSNVSGSAFFGGAITTTSTLSVTGSSTIAGQLNAVGGAQFGTLNASGIFTSTATGANVFPYASSTALTVSGTGYFGTASSTNVTISSIASGNLLKTTTAGSVVAAVAGVDYAAGNVAFPFTPTTNFGVNTNATGTIINFTQGIQASSTSYFTLASTTALNAQFASTTFASTTVLSVSGSTYLTGFTSSASSTVAGIFNAVAGLNAGVINASGIFTSTATGANVLPYASSTALTVSGTGYFGTASSTNLTISSIATGNLLKTTTAGSVIAAVAGTDYITPAGLASAFPFTATTYGNSTSTTIGFTNGILATASSTINANATTTGTFFANIASSSQLYGAGINSCTGSNALTWSGGLFGCVAMSAGSSFPFTPTTNFGVNTSATSTVLNATVGIFASSTSRFSEISTISASSTLLTVTSSSTIGGQLNAVNTALLASTTLLGSTILVDATTTNLAITGTASTTRFYGSFLNTCNGGNVLTWAAGAFGCTPDQTAAGAANPFTFSTNFGVLSAATTSPIWAQQGIFASTTSNFSNITIDGGLNFTASTTNATTTLFTLNGRQFLSASTSASNGNLYLGLDAGQADNKGTANTGIGFQALQSVTTGGANTALGFGALNINVAGQSNTVIGYHALQSNTGSYNVAVGDRSTNDSAGNRLLTGNTLVGSSVLVNPGNGNDYNTLIGYQSGVNVHGYGNTFLGANVDDCDQCGYTGSLGVGFNNIAIGYNSRFTSTTASNSLNIGNYIFGTIPATTSSQTLDLPTSGSLGIGTTSPYAKFSIAANNGDTATTLFAIGSSTPSATSTLFAISNTGSVGIGTTSSAYKVNLDLGTVASNANIGYNVSADATGNIGFAGYNLQLKNSTQDASGYVRLARTSGTNYLGMEIASQSRDGIRFLTDTATPAEYMRITAAGSVGIGTTSPASVLSVQGNGYISSSLFVGGAITSTSSSASTFPYASSTALTVSGTGYFGTASTTNLNATFASTSILTAGLASTTNVTISSVATGNLLKTTTAGSVIAAVAGTDYITPAGLASAFPFTPTTNYGATANSTTTPVWLKVGVQASSTSSFDQINIGSSTSSGLSTSTIYGNLSVRGNASTTALVVSGLNAAACDVKADVNGVLSCGTDATGSGSAFPFTPATYNGVGVNATSSALWLTATSPFSLIASSTFITYASTTQLTVSGGLMYFSSNATTTIPNNSPYAWSIATSTTGGSLFTIDTTSGAEQVTLGASGAATNIQIGDTSLNTTIAYNWLATSTVLNGQDNVWSIATSTSNVPIFSISTRASPSGFVGIGTSSPWAKFSIDTSGLGVGVVPFVVGSSTRTDFVVTQSGKVGIGTTSPIAQFHVAGLANPSLVASTSALLNTPTSVVVQGRYAYIADAGSVVVYDVSVPAFPVKIGSSTFAGNLKPQSLFVQGKYLYALSLTSLVIFDISNASSTTQVASVSTSLSNPYSLFVQGKFAYITSNGNGTLVVYDVSNVAAPVVATTTGAGGLRAPSGIYVQGRYAYITDNSSLSIFDVNNPLSPLRVASTTQTSTGAVYVSGRYAYVVGTSTSNIYDVASPNAMVQKGSLSTGNSIFVQGRYAYIANPSNKLDVYDVSTPSSPASMGSGTGLGTMQQVSVQGRYAYVADKTSFSIYDLGGAYIQQAEFGGLEAASLAIKNLLSGVDASFLGGVAIGQTLNVTGRVNIMASTTGLQTLSLLEVGNATGTASVFTALYNGNVGIGTSSPTGTLTVAMGSSTPAFFVGVAGSSSPAFVVSSANNSGNVGIGTTTPGTTFSIGSIANFSTGTSTIFTALAINAPLSVTGGVSFKNIGSNATSSSFANLCIDKNTGSVSSSTVFTGCTGSSERFKHNIAPLSVDSLALVNSLQTNSFIYNEDPTNTTTWGFIAEQANAIDPHLALTQDGLVNNIVDRAIMAVTVGAIQQIDLNLQTLASSSAPTSTLQIASSTATSTRQAQTFAVGFFNNLFGRMTGWLASAGNGIADLFADTIHAKTLYADKLCLGKTCVTEAELQAFLGSTNSASSPPPSSSGPAAPPPALPSDTTATTTPATTTSATTTAPIVVSGPSTSDTSSSTIDTPQENTSQ